MKKKLLAIAFAILVFPFALLLTACGGGKLQIGKTYVLDSLEIIWGSSQETSILLAGMTEAEFIEQTKSQLEKTSLEFKANGTVISAFEEIQTTFYYQTQGNTVTIYKDSAKNQVALSMKIDGEKLVQEQTFAEGMTTKIKITYKVGTLNNNGDNNDDDGDDGDTTPQVEIGKTYVLASCEIVWGSDQEKQLILQTIEEQEFVKYITNQFSGVKLVFNQDGTLTVKSDNENAINYYAIDEDTINIYEEAAKTEVVGTMKIVANTLVMEQPLEEGMTTKIKTIYRVGTTTDDDNDDNDDNDDTTAQLQTGKTYVFNELEIVWGSDEEKNTLLGLMGATEEQLIITMSSTLNNTYLLFNQDGTLSSNAGDGVEGVTYYYDIKGDIVTAYSDSAKTDIAATMKIVGDTIVHEEPMGDGMSSYLKMTYKVGTINDDDDNKDDNQGLQIGKEYVLYKIDVVWANDQEKQTILENADMTEQQFIEFMQFGIGMTLVFNQDGTIISDLNGESGETRYYTVDGNDITIYLEEEKTQVVAMAKIVDGELVVDELIFEEMSSKIVMTLKINEITDDNQGLQIGKTYIVSDIEFNWANDQEKQTFLGSLSEQQAITIMMAELEDAYVVFNADGSVLSVSYGDEFISYYTVEGDTITIYDDAEKTKFAATLKVVGNTIVQEHVVGDGMSSTVKIIYKIGTINDDDKDDDASLKIGQTYGVFDIEIDWANEQEKQDFLGSMSEEQFIQMMMEMSSTGTIVFNEDGTVVSKIGDEPESVDYYAVEGNNVIIYTNAEKTEINVVLSLIENGFVQQQVMGDGMSSMVKITYKVQTNN